MLHSNEFDQSHPVVKAGYTYWLSKCSNGALPRWSDFDPADIKPLLPNIVVTHVLSDPRDFVEKITGERIIERSSINSAGKKWSSIPGRGPESEIWKVFSSIVDEKRPILNHIPYVGPHNEFMGIETVCCPISEDGMTVDRIVAFVGYVRNDQKTYSANLRQKLKSIAAKLRL